MKFSATSASSPSGAAPSPKAGASGTPPLSRLGGDGSSSAGKSPRNNTGNGSGGSNGASAGRPPVSGGTAFRTGDTTKSSARTGRPLMRLNSEEKDSDFAFQVPETPPRKSGFGKHFLDASKGFSLEASDDGDVPAVAPADLPFPLVEEDSARHVVCQDSLIPWTYLLSIPGKNVRDILIDAFNEWLKCSPSNLAIIKQIIGYLHTGSLIIDDIEDESLTRRGQDAAHVVYGIARSLNADVYFLALEKVLTLQSTECVMVFTNEMLNLHRGQGRDIFWRTQSYIATEEEYTKMVCDKTGGLFRMAIRFMQLLSSLSEYNPAALQTRPATRYASSSSFASVDVDTGVTTRLMSPSVYTATSDFTVLADQMALYFQVRDDLINLASPQFHSKKGFCEDITEGKLSYIALYALRTYQSQSKKKEYDELLSILVSKTTDRTKIKRALALMDDVKAFDHTVKFLKDLYSQIEQSIQSIGKNSKLAKLLEMIASEVDDCYDVRGRVINAS